MKLLVPPPLVFAFAMLLSWATARFIPQTRLELPYVPNLGLAVVALGLLLALLAVAGFVARRTTVSPHHPEKSSSLVTDGVYAFTRNPMYLALALFSLGAALMFSSPLGLLFTLVAAWFITRYQIKPEEAALSEIFGADYDAYRAKVRRWI